MKHRTGLRNKYRKGKTRSTYSTERKSVHADKYGEYDRGRCIRPDQVAGHSFSAIRKGETQQ